VQNRAIEIHDSELDQITSEGTDAVLHFPHVYIHSSEGIPAVDRGTGWGQKATIRIGNAKVEGAFLAESREANGGVHVLSDGALIVDGVVSDNLIPIPLCASGTVELRLECWGEIVRVVGDSAKLELLGDARYIEEFPGSDSSVG
jgi:hypothetical protein